MKWQKHPIELKDVPAFIVQANAMVKAANPVVEQIHCVYTLENNTLIYNYPLLDFLREVPTEKFTSFIIYQKVV